jgi:hypothetical protein
MQALLGNLLKHTAEKISKRAKLSTFSDIDVEHHNGLVPALAVAAYYYFF